MVRSGSSKLTGPQLLILACVRHLGYTNTRRLAEMTGYAGGYVGNYVYGMRRMKGLIEKGLLTNDNGAANALHLTEAGKEALRDIVLVTEGERRVRVMRVEAVRPKVWGIEV